MPQETELARKVREAQERIAAGTGKAPAAAPPPDIPQAGATARPTPPAGAAPPPTTPPPAATSLGDRVKKEQQRQAQLGQGHMRDAFNRWGYVYEEPPQFAQGVLGELQRVPIGVAGTEDRIQRWMQDQLAARSPAYKKFIEGERQKEAAMSPEERRKLGLEPFSPEEIKRRTYVPPGWPGAAGRMAAQIGEMYGVSEALPVIPGAGLLPSAARISKEAATMGGVTYAQTGDIEEAKKAAAWGAAGGAAGEVAGWRAPKKMEEALPFKKRVPLDVREEAAARAVRRGAPVPITRAEEKAAFPHLEPEIAHWKGIVDDLTKRNPAYSQRTIPINNVVGPVNKMIAKVRPASEELASSLEKLRDHWLDELGYKPAVAGTPARTVQVPLVQNGMLQFDRFGRPRFVTQTIPATPGKAAVTLATVADVQKLKESLGEALSASSFGDIERVPGGKRAMRKTYGAAQKGIEEAIPDRFKQYGNMTLAEMNHVMEVDIRLREAATDLLKKKPRAYGDLMTRLGIEAGAGLATQLTPWGREHREGIAGFDAALMASAILNRVAGNPLMMAKLMRWFRDNNVAVSATGYAAWKKFNEEVLTVPPRPGAGGGGRGGAQPAERTRGGTTPTPSAAAFPPARGVTLVPAIAQAIQQREGWQPGSRSQRNNNPGNIKPGNTVLPGQTGKDGEFAVFKDYQSGWNALLAQTQLNIRRGLNLNEFFGGKKGVYSGYAPASDRNQPLRYAADVGDALGIDPNTPLTSFLQ